MKPCSDKRKLIALLALDELDARETQELKSHLQSCEGCRNYLEEISTVKEKLAVVECTSEIETSEAFHRNLVSRLRKEESAAGWGIASIFGGLLSWRVALPVAAVCVVLIIGLQVQRQAPGVRPQPPTPNQIVSAPDDIADVAPSIGNYQIAADESLQTFDELLNREAKMSLAPVPADKVSMPDLADTLQ